MNRLEYIGIGDLSTNYFIKNVFLNLSISDHVCKINTGLNPFEDLMQNIYWFNEEQNYHGAILDCQKFLKDYENMKEENNNQDFQDLNASINLKIIELKLMPLFLENQEKYFSLLTKDFLKYFSYDLSSKILNDVFNLEFWNFIKNIFLRKINKKIFEKYMLSIKDFIKYWFHKRKYPFIITQKIQVFPKKIKELIFAEIFATVDKEINLDNSIKMHPIESLNLLKLIYNQSFLNEEFCERKIKVFLNSGHIYKDPHSPFYFLVDYLWNLFRFTSINKKLNLEQWCLQLKQEYAKKVNWYELKSDDKLDNKIIWGNFKSLYLDSLKAKSKNNLFFVFNELNQEKNEIINFTTNQFQRNNEDSFWELFQKKTYYDLKISMHDSSILKFMNVMYISLFVNQKYSEKYCDSLNYMFDIFSSKFELKGFEKWKLYFFLNAIKDKIVNKYDDSLIEKYNLIFLMINFIESILLILYNWKLKKEGKPLILLNDAIKIKEIIAKITDEEKQQLEFQNIDFISFNSLNYLYFNLYAPINIGGLDIRNKFIHGNFDILKWSSLYLIKFSILTLSIWEEITFNILLEESVE